MSKIWIHKSQSFTKNGKTMVCESDAEKGTIDRGWMEGLSRMLREGWTPGEIVETEVIQQYTIPRIHRILA